MNWSVGVCLWLAGVVVLALRSDDDEDGDTTTDFRGLARMGIDTEEIATRVAAILLAEELSNDIGDGDVQVVRDVDDPILDYQDDDRPIRRRRSSADSIVGNLAAAALVAERTNSQRRSSMSRTEPPENTLRPEITTTEDAQTDNTSTNSSEPKDITSQRRQKKSRKDACAIS